MIFIPEKDSEHELKQRFPNFFGCGTVRDLKQFLRPALMKKQHLFTKLILFFNKNHFTCYMKDYKYTLRLYTFNLCNNM